ncbi:MAG: MFS transporter [Methanoculleus sp. SDB]|nr:MAG: MFS transporter [Methanoculleus sp. SDB]
MRQSITLLSGIFIVMAISNAIVPVLPSFAQAEPALQGAIYSAYFFGAFLTVLPAGLLSDRIGKTPLIRLGLLLTCMSGILIILFPAVLPVLAARTLEGIGAGLFVPSALAWINSQPNHRSLSGHFIAALNLGLLTGLLGTGWLEMSMGATGGVVLFTALSAVPLVMSAYISEVREEERRKVHLAETFRVHFWLYISTVVLIGVTGVVTALYPEFTGESASLLSVQIGMMHAATMATSLAASRLSFEPVRTVRISALLMATAVMLSFVAPSLGLYAVLLMFAVIGGVAGFIINAQLAYLGAMGVQQGALMGLFNTATYAGMTLLPFAAGIIAQTSGFAPAFFVMALTTASMAFTIGRCRCGDAAH